MDKRELEIIQYQQVEGLTVFLNTVDYRTSHVHPEWELIWVLDQPLCVTSEQSQMEVHPGELVLFSPNSPHEFHKKETSCTFLCMQISPKLYPSLQHAVDGCFPGNYLSKGQMKNLKRDMMDLAIAYFQGKEYAPLYCVGKAALILHLLLTALPSHTLTPEEAAGIDRRTARLKRLIRFVDENYMHKIRLSDFAESENCSMSYLSHFVKDTTNMTFQEYVTSVRFNCACKMIRSGDYKMLDVCVESGFSDYRYFVRAFRRQFGMTPEQYSRHTRQPEAETGEIRHSLHTLERIYPREESLQILRSGKYSIL